MTERPHCSRRVPRSNDATALVGAAVFGAAVPHTKREQSKADANGRRIAGAERPVDF